MIRISQLKIAIGQIDTRDAEKELAVVENAVVRLLKIVPEELLGCSILRRSLDARKKEDIHYSYTVEIALAKEGKFLKSCRIKGVEAASRKELPPLIFGTKELSCRPVVVGFGPAGMFCALELARAGYCPIVVERGEEIEKRAAAVEHFWKTGILNPASNVQFGEGGAGTFSDGKLNTMVKDRFGRGRHVLEVFAQFGAPNEICYMNKPHIGTDHLRQVVKGIREEIIRLGGEVRFSTQLTGIREEKGQLAAIELNGEEWMNCRALVLAIGHSARDTFFMLQEKKLRMEAKAFAIGVRIEHEQEMISRAQYGEAYRQVPAADYKLSHQARNGRGIYSFCMCPGGFVINASSEPGHLVVNGMSNHGRDEKNANSALVVTVTPKDYGACDPLSGIAFQREWEEKAYLLGQGKIPVQTFQDFENNAPSKKLGRIEPNLKGSFSLANVRECLPEYVAGAIVEGIHAFDRKIKGFADREAVISGVETRTSSPVRIIRDDSLQSSISGIYPCGEGAGYAGGIMSAAMDGIKVYEAIAKNYAPKQKCRNEDESE